MALLAFMPFALGVVEAWSEEVVVLLSGAMVVCLLLRLLFQPAGGFARTWAYAPLGLFVLLTVVQLVPLPRAVLEAVTPNTVAMKVSPAGALSQPAPAGAMTISLYPLATERALRLALAVSAVFVVTVNVYRRTSQIERLLTAVAVVGGGIALLALAQIVTNAPGIYWRVPVRTTGGP
jgi:hypothetical protein